jgi:myosin-5
LLKGTSDISLCTLFAKPANNFSRRYEIFIPPSDWQKFQGSNDLRPICSAILEKSIADQEKYQIGLTKIFFRPGMVSVLDRMKKQRLDAIAVTVQKNYRRYIARKHYQALRNATIRIQALARGRIARRHAVEMRKEKAAITIQTLGRMYVARRAFMETRQAVVKIQAGEYDLHPR